METYNYDAAAAVPEGDAEMTPETDTAAAGIGDTTPAQPGFGPSGDVMPSLPSNNYGSSNTGSCELRRF